MISTATRNGLATPPAAILETLVADVAPPAPAPAADKPKKSLHQMLLDLAVEQPIQYQIRGWPRSGKSSLLVALANAVNERALVEGTTERSDALRTRSGEVITGGGTQPTKGDELEVNRFTLVGRCAGVVGCPHEPANCKAADVLAFYRQHPNFTFVPVIWGPRAHAVALRNVFFGQAYALQKKSATGTDPRTVLRAGFRLATNDERPVAMESYGVDGLDELLADPKLAKSRILVSTRHGSLARLRFEGLGRQSLRYEEILVELTEKVWRQERLNGLDALREILHGLDEPVLCVAGWDLVCDYDALYRQPDLPDELFRWFFGPHRARTSKNLITICNIRGRIKTDGPRLGQSYVQDTSLEGAGVLLSVIEERLSPIKAAPPGPPTPLAPESPTVKATAAPVAAPAPVPATVQCREAEEEQCRRNDALREWAFHTGRAMPVLFVVLLLAALLSVGAAAWWLTFLLLGGLAVIAPGAWTRLRTQLFRGTWSVFTDDSIELRRGSQQTTRPAQELRLTASIWERWLDTGRCYTDDDVRPWRVYRLRRFERASGLTAQPALSGAWALFSLGGIALVALWTTFRR